MSATWAKLRSADRKPPNWPISSPPITRRKLKIGQAHYSGLLYEHGGFVDDILVHKVADDHFFLCVNASNQEKDFEHIRSHNRFNAEVDFASDRYAQLAIQGPKARATLQKLTPVDLTSIKYYWFTDGEVAGVPARIAHTGYTGEDGFEIYIAPAEAERMWNEVLQAGAEFGIKPCGLGARNTLRLEAKMALYGHEIDASISPLEADLGWIVKLDKGEFVGREALAEAEAAGRHAQAGRALKCAAAGSAATATKCSWMARRPDGSPAARLRPRLNKNIGLCYLPVAQAQTGQDHPSNDPQPARGCDDGGNSVLQASEIKHVSRKLRYTKEHEWVLVEGDTGTIGITDHAQEELGDIVYVDLPKVGAHIEQGKSLGSVESVKAVSDIYSPVRGEVTEVNGALADTPEKLNRIRTAPAWLVKIEVERSRPRPQSLMTAADYQVYIGAGKVVALSSEVRFRAPRNARRLRSGFRRRTVRSLAGGGSAESAAGSRCRGFPNTKSCSISATAPRKTPTATPRFWAPGVYHHFRPVLVDTVVSRGEFLTSYTPYQAEISQGTLTAIFEFQTMICQLTGMDVANASMYDGSTAVPEAAMMAVRATGKGRVLVARSVHPEYREVLLTYAQNQGMPVEEFGYLPEAGDHRSGRPGTQDGWPHRRGDRAIAQFFRHRGRGEGRGRDCAQAWRAAGGGVHRGRIAGHSGAAAPMRIS